MIGVVLTTETTDSEPIKITKQQIDKISRLHPCLKTLIDTWRLDNPGQEPSIDLVLYYLSLCKQGEKDLEPPNSELPAIRTRLWGRPEQAMQAF